MAETEQLNKYSLLHSNLSSFVCPMQIIKMHQQ